MAVATQGDDSVGLGLLDEVVEALSFVGEVSPAFPAVFIGDELDAGGEDAEFCGFLELFFQPFPLFFSE